jgi:hypothetical protein
MKKSEVVGKRILRAGMWLALCGAALWCVSMGATQSRAQQPAGAGAGASTSAQPLPNAPQPKEEQTGTANFVGYLTKKSLFFPDIASSPYPLTTWQKFELFGNESISPASIVVIGVSAAYNQARDNQAGYGQGWDGFGKRVGAAAARNSSGAFFSDFLFASALHQDPRYFPHANPTFWQAVKYSAKRIVITQTDSGRSVVNTSGLAGTAAAESLAMLYLPRADQTGGRTAERFGTDLAWKFAGNMFKEYWPVFFRDMGLKNLKVVPAPATPANQIPADQKPPQR